MSPLQAKARTAGLAYLIIFIAAPFAALPAEGGLALWLVIMGVNTAKWRAQAGEG